MNIFVLMKRTFDTEEKIVIQNGKVSEEGAEFIINPYDEYAIEEAIQVRDQHGGEVTVVTVGNEDAEKELRTALAMGADKAVLINIEDDVENRDQYTTAKVLAEYLKDKSTPSAVFRTTSRTIVRKSFISTCTSTIAPVRVSSFSSGAMLFGRTVTNMKPSVTIFFSNALPE